MIVKTKNENQYYLSDNKKEMLILPELLSEFINSDGCLSSDSVIVDNEEVAYYKRKYNLLKKAGYFTKLESDNYEFVTKDLLERGLANSKHIIFETTEKCNLRCHYCGYGEVYSTFAKRSKNELPFEKAKSFLDFMINHWNSPFNVSSNKQINISFYGGEPLMNFPFIQKVVEYVSSRLLKNNYMTFSMTTNGTLLDKYIDFLVKWNFTLFISIDGDKYHNSYRVYANGKESFDKVFNNISLIKNRYPLFFDEKISFNSVFHKRSSYIEVSDFFQRVFNKAPLFLSLNTFGVAKDKEDEFKELYKNPAQVLADESECNPEIKKQFSSTGEKLLSFLVNYDSSLFPDYNALRFGLNNRKLPTGTCLPFQNRIHVSTSGYLLPCERVGSNFLMGKIENGYVDIFYDEIVRYYNKRMKQIVEELCSKCKNHFCKSCLFTMKYDKGKVQCGKFLTEKGFNNYVKSLIEECEDDSYFVSNFFSSIGKK